MVHNHSIRSPYNPISAKQRYILHRDAITKLNDAMKAGFYIEAIAIIESLVTDRLHARYSHLKQHSERARTEKSFGKLITLLKNEDPKRGNKELHNLYDAADKWRSSRNKAVHDAVKLNDGEDFLTFSERYKVAEQAAKEGILLFRALKAEMDRLKRLNQAKVKNAKRPAKISS